MGSGGFINPDVGVAVTSDAVIMVDDTEKA